MALGGIALCFVLLFTLTISQCRKSDGIEQKDSSLPEGWEWKKAKAEDLTQGSLVLVNRDYGYDPNLPQTVSVRLQVW